jgi:hypothetical protein
LESSLCVNIDPPQLALETKSSVDAIAASLLQHQNPQEGTTDDDKKDDYDTKPLSLVVGSKVRESSAPLATKSWDEAHQGHNVLDSSPRVINDKELVRVESDSQPLSLVAGGAAEVTPPPLRGESSRERKRFEQRVHDILGVSPRVTVDDGKKEEVCDQQAQSVATRSTVKVSAPFLRREVSREGQVKEQWALGKRVVSPMVAKYEATKEEFDHQLLCVMKESVVDVTPLPLIRESPTERKKEEQPVNDVICTWPQLKAE